ncbi:unnamed protein product [Staurois parvus]|uniref:Uncharacterized protein n=1 Tax=Staurois parvus TaxID=386267 RepID=A0ABN9C985_9NEOB|nr:unnamed protein product [Staurois parvus]
MSPLPHPRPSPPADASIRLLCSGPCEHRDVRDIRGTEQRQIYKFSETVIFLEMMYQTISHTFCPYCFVLCPACILSVLSAWKLKKIHGVQKASLLLKSSFRLAREQR